MLYIVVILGIVFIPFFIYKYSKLSDYHKYPGIIKGFETVYAHYPGYKTKGGVNIITSYKLYNFCDLQSLYFKDLDK